MNAQSLPKADPRRGIGSYCRLIDSSATNSPLESLQFGLTRPT